jgi:hypothetical protein
MESADKTEEKPKKPDSEEAVGFEIQEVRYSLPAILRELQIERRNSYFAKEIIDQIEISRMFEEARTTRAKRK